MLTMSALEVSEKGKMETYVVELWFYHPQVRERTVK